MSEVEGIPQKKLDRLWEHLMQLENQVGMPLRKKPRHQPDECPIINFAPQKDAYNRKWLGTTIVLNNTVYAYKGDKEIYPCVYTQADSFWWEDLSEEKRSEITIWVIEKIKERNER